MLTPIITNIARGDISAGVLTARAEITEEIKEMAYEADDFLIRPFSSNELLAHIDALISSRGGG